MRAPIHDDSSIVTVNSIGVSDVDCNLVNMGDNHPNPMPCANDIRVTIEYGRVLHYTKVLRSPHRELHKPLSETHNWCLKLELKNPLLKVSWTIFKIPYFLIKKSYHNQLRRLCNTTLETSNYRRSRTQIFNCAQNKISDCCEKFRTSLFCYHA